MINSLAISMVLTLLVEKTYALEKENHGLEEEQVANNAQLSCI